MGNAAIDLQLAGLATGPVDRAWYSPAGDRIWIQTSSGKTFETNDFDRWAPTPADTQAPPVPGGRSITLPEANAQVRNPAGPSPRVYAFGRFVYRSDDSGKNWENLTAFHGLSIVGDNLRDLAVSPTNEDEIVVAGSAGIFRSLDAGRSWSSLNDGLPNLPPARIRSLPEGAQGTQIELPGAMVLEWQPGERQAWRPANNSEAADEFCSENLEPSPQLRGHRVSPWFNRTFIPAWRTAESSSPPIVESIGSPIGRPAKTVQSPPSGWIPPIRATLSRCSRRGYFIPSTAGFPGSIFPRIFRRRRSRRHRRSVGQRDLPRYRSGCFLRPDKSQRVERYARFLDRAGGCRRACLENQQPT